MYKVYCIQSVEQFDFVTDIFKPLPDIPFAVHRARPSRAYFNRGRRMISTLLVRNTLGDVPYTSWRDQDTGVAVAIAACREFLQRVHSRVIRDKLLNDG